MLHKSKGPISRLVSRPLGDDDHQNLHIDKLLIAVTSASIPCPDLGQHQPCSCHIGSLQWGWVGGGAHYSKSRMVFMYCVILRTFPSQGTLCTSYLSCYFRFGEECKQVDSRCLHSCSVAPVIGVVVHPIPHKSAPGSWVIRRMRFSLGARGWEGLISDKLWPTSCKWKVGIEDGSQSPE